MHRPAPKPSQPFRTSRAIALWLVTAVVVFFAIDAVATRPTPIMVEAFRQPGMTDEQVLSQAVQAAYDRPPHLWWIHSPRPFLVFEAGRRYDIDAQFYAAFDLEVTTDADHNMIGRFTPAMAVARPR